MHPGRCHRAGDIRAHKGIHTGRIVYRDAQQLGLLAKQPVCRKGGMAQGFGISAGEQIEHGGVSRYHQKGHSFPANARLNAGLLQKAFDGLLDLLLQLLSLALQGSTDTAHNIGGNTPLGIHGCAFTQNVAALQVVQLQRQGGGANIHRRTDTGCGTNMLCGDFIAGQFNAILLGIRQPDLGICQDHRLAGQAVACLLLCLIGRRYAALQHHFAFSASTPTAAGMIRQNTVFDQNLLQFFGAFKRCQGQRSILMDP